MASINKALIVGHLGKDPEVVTFADGGQVANVSIATTDKWKDKQSGEMREATEWHRVVFHGRLAEIAGQYLRKGALVYVEGSLRTRKWTDQSGVEKYSTEIRADNMQMLGGRRDDAGGESQAPPAQQWPQDGRRAQPARRQSAPAAPRDDSWLDGMDDDPIPF